MILHSEHAYGIPLNFAQYTQTGTRILELHPVGEKLFFDCMCYFIHIIGVAKPKPLPKILLQLKKIKKRLFYSFEETLRCWYARQVQTSITNGNFRIFYNI